MKKTVTKIIVILLSLAMLLPLASCANNETNGESTTSLTAENGETTYLPPDENLEIKIKLLTGTTALGMAKMIDDSNNNADSMNYNISLEATADAITGPLLTGECAIGALPTNAAVRLYNKSNGAVKLLALNTLGVLYLIQAPEQNVTDISQLKGKTVYLPGAKTNPEYITKALLDKAGLVVGTDVFLDADTYPSPDALVAAVASGNAPIAVLPEPKVSAATAQNTNITVALDLTKEWEKVYGENTLVQGCLVVNTKFADEHPAEIAKFLEDYEASVKFINDGTDDAINMIVSAGILPKAPIAKKALPNCNLCFIAGNDMKALMNTFCDAIFKQDAESIGKMPDDNFYYVSPIK